MEGTPVEIVDIGQVGPGTVALRIESPPGFDARPGQFVQLRAVVDGGVVTRHYSISAPRVAETFELTVGVDPEGTLSPWLAGSTAGATVEVDGPYGRVYYEDEPRVVVLAAGPGIGAAVGVAEATVGGGGDAAIVYHTDALVHEARLARLAFAGARVYVVGRNDTFEPAVHQALADVDRGQVFVYGFAPFVETAEAAISTAGGDPRDAKVENFG